MPTVSSTNYVDINLQDFTTDELIEELSCRGESTRRDISEFEDSEVFAEVEARGHYVTTKPAYLTQADIQLLLSIFPSEYKVGSEMYFVYEKLVLVMQNAKV